MKKNWKHSYIKPEITINYFRTKEFWMMSPLSGAEDPVGGAPPRRSMPEGGDKAF